MLIHQYSSAKPFLGITQSTLSSLFSDTVSERYTVMLTFHSAKPILGSIKSTLTSL